MKQDDKQAATAVDPKQYEDNERDDAYMRYDQYWFAFRDWCAAHDIPEEDMRTSDYQVQFERDFYGD